MANPILSNGQASPQSIFDQYLVAATNQTRAEGYHPVGTRAYLDDGRVFYYATNGATQLSTAVLCVVPVTEGLNRSSSHDIMALTAGSAYFVAGTYRLNLSETDVNADIIENEYKDGYMYVQNSTGEGYNHKIRGHTSFDASGSATTGYIDLYDPIQVTGAATTEISLARNPYDRVITSTTAVEETPLGVTPRVISASTALATDVTTTVAATDTYFFWCQTWGPAVIEAGSTSVASGVVLAGGATVDQVDIMEITAGTGATPPITGDHSPQVGWGLVSAPAAQADYVLVDLRIRP